MTETLRVLHAYTATKPHVLVASRVLSKVVSCFGSAQQCILCKRVYITLRENSHVLGSENRGSGVNVVSFVLDSHVICDESPVQGSQPYPFQGLENRSCLFTS